MMLHASIKDTDSSLVLPDQTCKRFTLVEIQSATNNFDETLVIGRGGFGKVYRSPTKIGLVNEVAIKRLHSTSNQGANEFEAEVNVLSKLRHGNLVSLIGYCNEEKEMVLIYEFMPNGTLEDHLRTHTPNSLSWLQRLNICIGAARGLDYLQTTQHGVIHRDVKSSNILLDANFDAKISDFGLAKVGSIDRTHMSTAVKGTFGYMDPSYFYTGKLTRKSDVYAFGVVLFEVVSGRKAVDSTLDEEQWGLAAWAQYQIKHGKLNQIIDPRLMGQISKKCLKEFASIARHCLHTQPKQRPTMAEIVVKLESVLSQERESANFVVDEEGFVFKLRSLFIGKVDVATGSKDDSSSHQKPIVDAAIRSNSNTTQSFKTFTYHELKIATNNFKYKEHFRSLDQYVYKGWLDEKTYAPTIYGGGLVMYVRKKEISTLKNIKLERFNNLDGLKLLGYCLSNHELFFVYEVVSSITLETYLYITLDKYLYGEPARNSLSWVARLKIAMGAAEGLFHLHKRNKPAYCCQFKTDLILVDKDFNARLSSFDCDPHTFQLDAHYAAPEWFRYQADTFDGLFPKLKNVKKYDLAIKNEVYAFGLVLLEILTGLKVYDSKRPSGEKKLVEWAFPLLADEGNLGMIMDPQLQHDDCLPKGAFKLAQLVSNCLQIKRDKRPSMDEILEVLHHCYQEEVKTV